MEKEKIRKSVLEKLNSDYDELQKGYSLFKEESVDAPGAMQSHSDTSRFQANVLADNMILQAQKIKTAINLIENLKIEKGEKIEVGSLVKIKDGGKLKYFYIVPEGVGGFVVNSDGIDIQVVSINSPIGKELFSKSVGKIEIKIAGNIKLIEILEIN
jgi:transcription elongation GreA/GreB family factor